jgi:NADPH:quinone reductase-like Zn-dependent oxidoreductase
MLEQPDKELMDRYQVNSLAQSTRITSDSLRELSRLFDNGVIRVSIDRVFPLDEAAQALEYQRNGTVNGKVVIALLQEG